MSLGSFEPPWVKIEVPRPSLTKVWTWAVPPPQFTVLQSSGAPAGLSEMSPSTSNEFKMLSSPWAGLISGDRAIFGTDAVVVTDGVFFLAFVKRADVVAHVATNKTANTSTPNIHFAKFGFLVTGVSS